WDWIIRIGGPATGGETGVSVSGLFAGFGASSLSVLISESLAPASLNSPSTEVVTWNEMPNWRAAPPTLDEGRSAVSRSITSCFERGFPDVCAKFVRPGTAINPNRQNKTAQRVLL